MVMKDGKVVESGTAEEIFERPMHPYTVQLLDAVPHLGAVIGDEPADGQSERSVFPEAGSDAPVGGATTAARPEAASADGGVHRAGLARGRRAGRHAGSDRHRVPEAGAHAGISRRARTSPSRSAAAR